MCLGALAVGVVSLNTYYAADPACRNRRCRPGRAFCHWSYAASLPLAQHAQWLGVGVGQFAEAYFWHAPQEVFPGLAHTGA